MVSPVQKVVILCSAVADVCENLPAYFYNRSTGLVDLNRLNVAAIQPTSERCIANAAGQDAGATEKYSLLFHDP